MARPPRRAPRYAPSPPLVLAVVLVACLEGRGDAAVIPSPPKATPSDVAVLGLDGPALRTFREPPRTFETGLRDEPEGRLREGQAGALDQRAGLAAPRPEPALVDEYQLALTDHLDRRFSLDAALALLRDPERDASLELGPRLRELGVEVKEGLISSKVSSLVQSLGQDLSAIQSTHPVSATARRKVSLLQAILAALQVLSDAPGAQGHDQDKEQEQPPEEDHTGPPGQETPIKKPVFSDQYLPALVQVLSHVVDEVVILEQAATKPPNSLVTTWPLGDTSGSGGSPPETTTQAETSISANSTQTQEASSTEEPASGNEDESSTEVIQVAVVPKPVNGTFVPAQIVIAGPLQGIADLLQHVSSNLNKDPANHVSIIVEDESAKKGGVKHTAKEEENKADNSDSFFKEALIHAVEDIEKANLATINKVTKDVAEDIVKEITLEVLKQTHLMTDLRSEALEDYTEDGDSMPVIQNDVPIINEENVPMTMVMSMVPSDAPEMVMNMTSDESLDDADSESTTILPSAGLRSEATQKDDKSIDTILAGDEPIEQVIESVDFEDLRDNAFLVNGIRGKEKKSVPPSKPLLKLVKLRFALSAEAKRQNFKNIQGYSKTVMDQLVTTSLMTGREQLGTLLATVLKRDEIKSPKIKASATKTLEELEDEKSALSLKLVDVPALKYAP